MSDLKVGGSERPQKSRELQQVRARAPRSQVNVFGGLPGSATHASFPAAQIEELLKCSLCLSIVCDPITIPCGHSFCRVCLTMALQRSKKKCPNCRAVCHVDPQTHSCSVKLAALAEHFFPKVYRTRLDECKAVKHQIQASLPIFFYNNLLFPGCVLRLFLFEQRYRHMINRCVSGNRRFIYLPRFGRFEARAGDVGLIAHIEECEFLPDGRALMKATIHERVNLSSVWVEEGTQGLYYCQYSVLRDNAEQQTNPRLVEMAKQHVQAICRLVPSLRSQAEYHIGKEPSSSNIVKWSFWFTAFAVLTSRSMSATSTHLLRLLKGQNTQQRISSADRLLIAAYRHLNGERRSDAAQQAPAASAGSQSGSSARGTSGSSVGSGSSGSRNAFVGSSSSPEESQGGGSSSGSGGSDSGMDIDGGGGGGPEVSSRDPSPGASGSVSSGSGSSAFSGLQQGRMRGSRGGPGGPNGANMDEG